jgi:hypothetical protein
MPAPSWFMSCKQGCDLSANFLRLRLDRGRDGTQGAASAIELIHERQHHGHAVFLDPQLMMKLAYETDASYVQYIETKIDAVALRTHPVKIDPTLNCVRQQAVNHLDKLFCIGHELASARVRGS